MIDEESLARASHRMVTELRQTAHGSVLDAKILGAAACAVIHNGYWRRWYVEHKDRWETAQTFREFVEHKYGLRTKASELATMLVAASRVHDNAAEAIRRIRATDDSMNDALDAAVNRDAAVRAAAGRTTEDTVPKKQGERNDLDNLSKSQHVRASASGIGVVTQRKLDALAKRAPDLLEAVQRGELSCHAAAIRAGVVRPTWTAPADVDRLAVAIAKRFPGYALVKVGD